MDPVQAIGNAWTGDSTVLFDRLRREDEAIARERDRHHRATPPPPLPAEVPGRFNVSKASAHVDAGCLVQVLRRLDTA